MHFNQMRRDSPDSVIKSVPQTGSISCLHTWMTDDRYQYPLK